MCGLKQVWFPPKFSIKGVILFKRAVAIAASVLAVGVLFGCGGSGSGNDSSATGAETQASGTEANTAGAGTSEPSGGTANGGEGGSSPGTAIPVAFVKEGNKICESIGPKLTHDAIEYIGNAPAGAQGQATAEIAVVGSVILPKLEEEAAQLGSLSAPAEAQEGMNATLAGYQEVIAEGKENPEKFFQESRPYQKLEEPANEIGLTECPL